MIECPACAGPVEVRVGCATCGGTTKVTQEVADAFIVVRDKQDQLSEFMLVITSTSFDISGSYTLSIGEQTHKYENGTYSIIQND